MRRWTCAARPPVTANAELGAELRRLRRELKRLGVENEDLH
jgi:hypothetical protein